MLRKHVRDHNSSLLQVRHDLLRFVVASCEPSRVLRMHVLDQMTLLLQGGHGLLTFVLTH